MVRSDRSKYTHFNVDSRWRIWVMDVPGDIVIGVDYLDAPHPKGKWENLVHLDETRHKFFHAHIPPNVDDRIPLGTGLSREEKLRKGFEALAKYAEERKIKFEGDFLAPKDVWTELEQQVLESRAPKGTSHHNVSITAGARIITAPPKQNTIKAVLSVAKRFKPYTKQKPKD